MCVENGAASQSSQDAYASLLQDLHALREKQASDEGAPAPDVAWINAIVSELWPTISVHIARIVKENIEPEIQDALPRALAGKFHIHDVSLGDAPVQFGSVTVETQEDMGDDRDAKNIKIHLGTVHTGHVQIGVAAADSTFTIDTVQLQGILTIVLEGLFDEPPFVAGMSVFFTDSPTIKITWNGTASVLTLLRYYVHNAIRRYIGNLCVLPRRIAVVFDRSQPYEEFLFALKNPIPQGCLHVHVFAARSLEARDTNVFVHAKSDPFCTVRVGGQELKSKIIKTTCNPKWNEEFTFQVFDLKSQQLCVDVFDEDSQHGDHFLGHVQMSLADILMKCRVGATWLPLGPHEDVSARDKVQGEVQIMARWLPVSVDQEQAYAIGVPKHRPQALMFLCLFSIKVPSAISGTAYTIQVTCDEQTHTLEKALILPAEEEEDEFEDELPEKVAKLRNLKATDEDIAEILSIPVESLNEHGLLAAKRSSILRLEEPFFWFVDVPMLAAIDIVVSQGEIELATLQVDAAECLNEKDCMQRGVLKDGDVVVDLLAQVMVVGDERSIQHTL